MKSDTSQNSICTIKHEYLLIMWVKISVYENITAEKFLRRSSS